MCRFLANDYLITDLAFPRTLFIDSFERVNHGERLQILEWISSIPYGKYHDTVKEARTSDICEWLL